MQRRQFIAGLLSALPVAATAGEGSLFGGARSPLISLNGNRSPFQPLERIQPAAAETTAPAPQARPDTLDFAVGVPILRMWNANTDETLSIQPVSGTGFDSAALDRINRFMRDWRRNEVKAVDARAVLGLLQIQEQARRNGFNQPVRFLSGYRSRATNDMLRERGNGAARNSLHIEAKAIDFSLPGVSIADTLVMAKAIDIGGVGGYPTFVHIDTGRRRFWGSAA